MIQGVIFDMDGLMFDTERMWATFWEPALAALGLPYKEGLAEAERGTAGETSRNIVRSFYGEDCDANAIIDSLHRVADKEFQKPVPKSRVWMSCWRGWTSSTSPWQWLPPAGCTSSSATSTIGA